MIDIIKFTSDPAVGADGSATVTAYSMHVQGKVHAIAVEYTGDDPATSDVVISCDTDPVADPITTLTDNATNNKVYPRRLLDDNAGSALTTVYDYYVVNGRIKAILSQGNTNDTITVTVWLEH